MVTPRCTGENTGLYKKADYWVVCYIFIQVLCVMHKTKTKCLQLKWPFYPTLTHPQILLTWNVYDYMHWSESIEHSYARIDDLQNTVPLVFCFVLVWKHVSRRAMVTLSLSHLLYTFTVDQPGKGCALLNLLCSPDEHFHSYYAM